jgi:hypothetical protein
MEAECAAALVPLRRQALPLLRWIAIGDNPKYDDLLKWDYHAEWFSEFTKESFADLVESEERRKTLAQQRFRQNLHRLRAIFTSREPFGPRNRKAKAAADCEL